MYLKKINNFLFHKKKSLEKFKILEFFENLDSLKIKEEKFVEYKNGVNLLFNLKLTQSKSEAKRLIKMGGFYINNKKISLDESENLNEIKKSYLLAEKYIVLRIGKKQFYLLEII